MNTWMILIEAAALIGGALFFLVLAVGSSAALSAALLFDRPADRAMMPG